MDLNDQVVYVRDFIIFLKKNMENTAQGFEKLQGVSGQELCILTHLSRHGDVTVKDIAQQLPDVSLSTLTRFLDSLEEKQYVTRNVNLADRRSFIVALTEEGRSMVSNYGKCMEEIAHMMLISLSPAERMMLIELYAKTWRSLSASKEGREVSAE